MTQIAEGIIIWGTRIWPNGNILGYALHEGAQYQRVTLAIFLAVVAGLADGRCFHAKVGWRCVFADLRVQASIEISDELFSLCSYSFYQMSKIDTFKKAWGITKNH